MRTLLLPLAAALLLTACGANSGTPQNSNNASSVPQNNNNALPQDSNNGGNPNATTQVTGSVQGHALAAKSAIYSVGDVSGTQVLVLLVSDQPEPCAALTANAHTKNSTSLTTVLVKGDSNGNSVAPTSGTYSVSSAAATSLMSGQAELFAYDATCTSTLSDDNATASTGTVSVTSSLVDGTTPLVGTFDMVMGSQNDKLSGSFTATGCSALITAASGGRAGSTCQ